MDGLRPVTSGFHLVFIWLSVHFYPTLKWLSSDFQVRVMVLHQTLAVRKLTLTFGPGQLRGWCNEAILCSSSFIILDSGIINLFHCEKRCVNVKMKRRSRRNGSSFCLCSYHVSQNSRHRHCLDFLDYTGNNWCKFLEVSLRLIARFPARRSLEKVLDGSPAF